MREIETIDVKAPHGEIIAVTIFVIEYEQKDLHKYKPKRVYTIAANTNGEIALVYNSKHSFWGFPGGHVEEGESVCETAEREYLEESHLILKHCKPYYIFSLGGRLNKETEVVCFGLTQNETVESTTISSDEEISQVAFFGKKEVLQKLGNESLWGPVVSTFYENYLMR